MEINFCATAWSDGGILTCVLFAVVVLLACCCSWICSSCCFCIRASCSRCCWYCSAVKAERDESLLPIWKMTIHTIIDNIRLSCWDWTDSYAEKHDRGVVMRFVEKARWAIKEDQEPSVNVACKGRVWFDVALKYSADIFSSYCQDFVVSPAAASGATKVVRDPRGAQGNSTLNINLITVTWGSLKPLCSSFSSNSRGIRWQNTS